MIYLTLTLLIVVGLLIIFVNLFTLATIFSSRCLTKPANYPIIFFLITATVQGFVVVPAYCLKHLKFDNQFAWICDLFRFPYFVCGHLLTLNLVLVCIDRIIATRYPLRYGKIITRARMIIAIVAETVVVIIVDLIPFGNKIQNQMSPDDNCVYIPWAEWSIAVVMGAIVLPLLFITVSYAWIWLVALRLSNNRPQLTGRRKVSITKMISHNISKILELRATKTSALLIGVFVLCWSPIAVYYLIENICGSCILDLFNENQRPRVGFAVKVISFTTSIFSPLAYCWRTREFQRELRKNLNKRRWKAARIALSFIQGGQKNATKTTLETDGTEGTFKPRLSLIPVDQVSVKQLNLDQLSVDQFPVVPSSVDQCPVVPLSMDQYPVVPLSVDQCPVVPLSADQCPIGQSTGQKLEKRKESEIDSHAKKANSKVVANGGKNISVELIDKGFKRDAKVNFL